MNALDHHEAWEMKPRKLSVEELENPVKVVEEFFQFAALPQTRWYLWEMMKVLVSGSYTELDSKERMGMICFYEQLEKLIEGIYVMHGPHRA